MAIEDELKLEFIRKENKEEKEDSGDFPTEETALDRYEKIRTSEKTFHKGTDFIEVSIFDDNTEDAHFGDPEHSSWVLLENMSPELDPPPAEKLYRGIQQNYPAGGWAMVRFFRSNKKKVAQPSQPPIFIPIKPSFGVDEWERQKYILEMKRKDRLEKERLDEKKEEKRVELTGISKMLDMQMEKERIAAEQARIKEQIEFERLRQEKDREHGMFKELFSFQLQQQQINDERRMREKEESGTMFMQLMQQMQESQTRQTQMLAAAMQGQGRSSYDDDDNTKNLFAIMMQNQQQQAAQQSQMMGLMMTALVEAMKTKQASSSDGSDKYVTLLQQSHANQTQMMQQNFQQMLHLQQNNSPARSLDDNLNSLSRSVEAIKGLSLNLGIGGGESASDSEGPWGMIGKIAERVAPDVIERLMKPNQSNGASLPANQAASQVRPPTQPPPAAILNHPPIRTTLEQNSPVGDSGDYDQEEDWEPDYYENYAPQQAEPLGPGIFGMKEEDSAVLERDLKLSIQANSSPELFLRATPKDLVEVLKSEIPREEFIHEIQSKSKDGFLKSVKATQWLTKVRKLIYN